MERVEHGEAGFFEESATLEARGSCKQRAAKYRTQTYSMAENRKKGSRLASRAAVSN